MNSPAGTISFTNLIAENRNILFKVCNAYCRNKSDIDDLAQEMVFQLWKSYERYDPAFKFQTWMYRVVLNVAISFYRKSKNAASTVGMSEHLIDIEDLTDLSEQTETDLQLLQQFIHELKDLDRGLMILYLEEKPYKEIAEIIGISESNVSTRISRIKDQLKQRFQTHQS